MNNKSNPYDNYYLADMQPSLKVIIDIKTEVSAAIFRSVLSFCKQWNIKDIILKIYDLNNAKIFDQLYNAISDTFLFSANDFNFYLQYENLEISVIQELWKNKENPNEFLLPYLSNNKNYEIQFQSFGTDVVRFFDYKPEIFTVLPENKKINFTLKDPENVFALFYYENQSSKNIAFQTVDLNKYFNRKNGKVVFPWKINKEIKLFVIRKIYGYVDNALNQKLNYFSEKVFKTYLKYLDSHLDKDSKFFKGVFIQPYKTNSVMEQSIPVSSIFVEKYHDKKGKDFSKTALSFWHQSGQDAHLQSIDLFNFSREQIQNTLNKSYNSYIKSNNTKLVFEIADSGKSVQKNGKPIYLFDFASNLNDFCVYVDSNNIFPNGTYCNQKEIELRIASSITHHYEDKTANIKCGKLLNTKNNFEDKLWYINWLISCGTINIIQDIIFDYTELKINLYNNLPTYDPSYLAYKQWFHYIQTISQFARKGIHRCDILVLYPTESYFYGDVEELSDILPRMANEGIDFDLIDYSGFINNDLCKIDNNALNIKKEKYPILVLPGVEIIPGEVLRKIYEFYRAGGTVIAIGHLPTKSTNWDEDNEIESISNEIWFKKSSISSTKFKTNKWGGKGYFQSNISLLPEIIAENRQLLNFQLFSETGKVRVLIKELPTEYYLILFNHSETEEFNGTIHSKYKGKPYIWDFDKNEVKEFHDFNIKNSFLQFPMSIPAKQSKIIIIKKQSLKSLPKIVKTNLENITEIKMQNQKIIVNSLIKDKGKYEAEINLFNITKKATKSIQKFLPVLTISNNNWNIEFNSKRIIDSLGDLSRYDHTYYGTITYKKIIVISKEYLKDYRVFLDLGKIKDIVEVYINNNNLGMYMLPPFKMDISQYIVTGDNKFEFKVKNNLSNALSSLETVEQKIFYIKEYGLYGPVKIIPYKEIELTC